MKKATPPSVDRYFSNLWNLNQGFIIAILLIIVLIVIYQTSGTITQSFRRFWNNVFGSPYRPDNRPAPDNTNIPNGWTPDAMVLEFYTMLEPYDLYSLNGSQKCQMAKRIYELNDDQFKSFVNEFERKYATDDYPTLKSHMQKEYDTCSVFSTDWFSKVYQKLNRLGY